MRPPAGEHRAVEHGVCTATYTNSYGSTLWRTSSRSWLMRSTPPPAAAFFFRIPSNLVRAPQQDRRERRPARSRAAAHRLALRLPLADRASLRLRVARPPTSPFSSPYPATASAPRATVLPLRTRPRSSAAPPCALRSRRCCNSCTCRACRRCCGCCALAPVGGQEPEGSR